MSTNIKYSSGAPWEDKVGYSRAVKSGPLLSISGTTAVEDGIVQFPGNVGGQTEFILSKLFAVLKEAGYSPEHIIRTRMYVTNIKAWQAVADVHSRFLGDVRPAATMVEVSKLIDPDLCIEIEMDAWKEE